LPGIPNATASQIDLAARGATWGEVLGVGLDNNLGPLPALANNFLEDAGKGIAIYSAPLTSQPNASTTTVAVTATVQMTGVTDHAGT